MQTIKPEMKTQTSGGFPFLPEKKPRTKQNTSLAILKQILDIAHPLPLHKKSVSCTSHIVIPLHPAKKKRKLLEELWKTM